MSWGEYIFGSTDRTDIKRIKLWLYRWDMALCQISYYRTEQNRFYLPNELTNNKEKQKI